MKLPVDYNEMHFTEIRKVREEYIKRQGGLCCYCNMSLYGPADKDILKKKITKRRFPSNFFKWPIHLHHNHDTGMTIGAVHNYCNAVSFEYDGV